MRRSDELDRKHLRLFAWRMLKPGDPIEIDISEDDPPSSKSTLPAPPGPQARAAEEVGIPVNADVDIDEALEKTRPECAAIEREVAQAWLMTGDEQVRATRGILRRVAKVGVALIGLGKLPSIRLARLVTRHYRRLSATQRSDCGYIFGLDLSHAESVELVAEAAQSHDDIVHLMSAGDDRSERPSWASPACAARLADLVGGNAKVRLAALELISHCALPDACPVLRRALRRPEWPVRARAAKLLLALSELGMDDCLFLLKVATGPLPRQSSQKVSDALELCADTLREVLPGLRPPGGDELLLGVLHDEQRRHALWLGGPWALQALAAAYPGRALDPIDRRLRADLAMDRLLAVTASGMLPDADAQPRLLLAATDPSSAVADWAKSTYYRLFAVRCPTQPLAGVATDLLPWSPGGHAQVPGELDASRKERFIARLGVLRVVSSATRGAWATALLAEAPDPEALALLVFLLGTEGATGLPAASLPTDAQGWSKALLARFGVARGTAALCALGGRFPFSRVAGRGWLAVLGDRIEDGAIPKSEWAGVRAFAEGALGKGPTCERDAERLLALTLLA